MLTPVSFYFLRHGETDWNRRRIIQGQTDTPLSAIGIAQAEAVKPEIQRLSFASICCSSLQRARSTAEIVNRDLKRPTVYFPDLMECGLGEIEGQPSDGVWRKPWEDGGPIPGGETFAEYTDRVLRGLNAALREPGPVLVVGHGGNFWSLERHGLIACGTRVPNCALFRLDPPMGGAKMWNVTPLSMPAGPSLAIGEGAAAP
jgi:broad specificity phosphatase PhoE